ncbi:MAG: hypothetical protein HY741_29460 [Chloroflexi bacterium]|nr:hypothetical protein [Chloroflexota bacterium]
MPNPSSSLSSTIQVLSELDILPATGGATEELLATDPDELDDILQNSENQEIAEFAECGPEPTRDNIYRATQPSFRPQDHLYRFFIDGSIRTYYLGTAVEEQRTFPVILSQIGAACVARKEDGHLKIQAHQQKLLLLIPAANYGLSDEMWRKLNRATAGTNLVLCDTTEQPLGREAAARSLQNALRDRAGAIARARMHDLERDLIGSTDAERNENSRLVLDGGIKSEKFMSQPYIIAVAKSFRKDVIFTFGSKKKTSESRKDITKLLMGLPHNHRTVAFSAEGGKVAFWYVRMRAQDEVDYPLKGVVKVEVALNNGNKITAAEADRISSALCGERNVTPYGKDNRWHCHLYPIYQAENAIKSRFFSNEVLLGSIRWNVKPKLSFV